MRNGSLTKLLAKLALPIFLDVMLVMMLGAADTFMLSGNNMLYQYNWLLVIPSLCGAARSSRGAWDSRGTSHAERVFPV